MGLIFSSGRSGLERFGGVMDAPPSIGAVGGDGRTAVGLLDNLGANFELEDIKTALRAAGAFQKVGARYAELRKHHFHLPNSYQLPVVAAQVSTRYHVLARSMVLLRGLVCSSESSTRKHFASGTSA